MTRLFPLPATARLDATPSGRFSMWWPTEEDPSFLASPCRTAIRSTYQAVVGIERSAMRSLLAPVAPPGFKLPAQVLVTTGATAFVVSLSPEKGLRIHFSPSDSSADHRNRLWADLADYVNKWRLVHDSAWHRRFVGRLGSRAAFEWWSATDEALLALEASGEGIQAIGTLVVTSRAA